MKRQRFHWRLSRRSRKILLVSAVSAAGVFVVLNSVLWVVYRNRTYPRTQVMQASIGSVAYGSLPGKISQQHLLPSSLVLVHNSQKVTAPLADLGITTDISRTTSSANKERSWLPILNLLASPKLQAPVSINQSVLQAKAQDLAKVLRADAANAQLRLTGATVSIDEGKTGYELDQKSLRVSILQSLDAAKTTIMPAVTTTQPKVSAVSLKPQQTDVQAQIKTAVTFTFNGKTKQASDTDVASWYIPKDTSLIASSDKIQAYIMAAGASFGIRVKDIPQVVTATIQALTKHQASSTALTEQKALKTFTYCTNVKGVDASNLAGLNAKLKETYSASKGWSDNGLVEFDQVASGCNFTVWLTAARLMPTFGDICDSMWSCRVGPNVVINFDRWQNASPSWNASAGTLDEYRHMVINHETGHWFGFNHATCPGAGQPAPVMQQQSISLQGCSFNAWPTSSEIAVYRGYIGI